MKNIFDVIKYNKLFEDIATSDIEKMFGCFTTKSIKYKKNEIIILAGDTINSVGLILSGSVKIIREDFNGHQTILTEISAPELFAEVFCCAGIRNSPVTVQASKDCEILFIDYHKIITSCSCACKFHIKAIENMLKIIANKNVILNQKNEILSKRSTREKIICFFDIIRKEKNKFTIPYNRQEMANYLCVDRSALSNELSKMRNEGIISFNKNIFEILI